MKLSDIKLNDWGHFNDSPASFTINQYDLPRPWSYIYTSDEILMRIDHQGCGYAQVDPPGGIMLYKPERYENFPLFSVWLKDSDGKTFTNFFKPNNCGFEYVPDKYNCIFKPEYAEYLLEFNHWKVITRIGIASDQAAIIMHLSIENLASHERTLDIIPTWRPHNSKADLALWDVPELYQSCKFFNNHGKGIMVETRDPDAELKNRKYSVLTTNLEANDIELNYEKFIGRGNYENPEALQKAAWSLADNQDYQLEDFRSKDAVISQLPIAAMRANAIKFQAGKKYDFSLALCHLRETDYRKLAAHCDEIQSLLTEDNWNQQVDSQKELYADWMSKFRLHTPDSA